MQVKGIPGKFNFVVTVRLTHTYSTSVKSILNSYDAMQTSAPTLVSQR